MFTEYKNNFDKKLKINLILFVKLSYISVGGKR
jgi:hypothetical protein